MSCHFHVFLVSTVLNQSIIPSIYLASVMSIVSSSTDRYSTKQTRCYFQNFQLSVHPSLPFWSCHLQIDNPPPIRIVFGSLLGTSRTRGTRVVLLPPATALKPSARSTTRSLSYALTAPQNALTSQGNPAVTLACDMWGVFDRLGSGFGAETRRQDLV